MEGNNKSKLDQLRDKWELIQIKRRRHQSIWYISYFLFAMCCYIIMLTFGIFVGSNDNIKSSQIGQTLQIGNTQYELLDKKLDRKNNHALFVVANPEGSISDLSKELQVSVEFLESSGEKAKVNLFEGDKGYYVVSINNLPQQWKALRITLREMSEGNTTSGTVILANKKEKSSSFVDPNEKNVMIDSFEYQISSKNKSIKAYRKEIETNEKLIRDHEEKIIKVQEETKYQTEAEQKQSAGTVEQIKGTISQIKSSNKVLENKIKELESQIEKVKERIEDYKK